MRHHAVFALAALALAPFTSCSDGNGSSNIILTESCGEASVTAPATAPEGPQFCALGRYLTTEATTGEDQDLTADYVTMAFGWRDAKGATFHVVSGPPPIDNVFDVGSLVRLGIKGTDDSCTATTDSPGFTSTAANGSCRVLQKVPAAAGPLTFTVEVRNRDTVVDTLTVEIEYAAT